ncbi:hypothetical protein ACFLRP_01315 [Bacteroidota bacterium]
MFPRGIFNFKAEAGYSLVGIIVACAIIAGITNGVMIAIFQLNKISSASTNHVLAIREVQTAGEWMNTDGRQATTIELTPDADGFPLTMKWSAPNDDQHEVVYTLTVGNGLKRQHYTNRTINPNPDTTILAAQYVDPFSTSCNITENDELLVNITVAVDIDTTVYTEARTLRIFPRQSLN